MRRFTVTPDRLVAGRVVFDPAETRHLARVLRLGPGAVVVGSSGDGLDHTIRIDQVGTQAIGTVLATRPRPTESALAVTLLQAVPKGDRMDTVVRLATELGVTRIRPVITERTIVRADPARWRDRTRRWARVAREATKQCGRAVVPDVDEPAPLAVRLEELGSPYERELRLCAWERAVTPLATVLADAPSAERVQLLVGPEGGLTDDEVGVATRHRFAIAALGPRILRTETAGPALLAILQFALGDLSTAPPHP